MAWTNSSLVTYTLLSPNCNSPRNHAIDTLTIHCMAGQLSVESCGNLFFKKSTKASSNYGIGPDGRIALYVPEGSRSWATSNAENDNRAVTIEVASDSTHPYAVTDAAYASLIQLCADICKRNGIKKLVWSDDKHTRMYHLDGANMTAHRDYKNKACPGDYLFSREADIAAKANAIISGQTEAAPEAVPTSTEPPAPKFSETPANFDVEIITADGVLNIRKYPSAKDAESPIVGELKTGSGVYHIEATSGNWGKLINNAGWINCSDKYVKKVTTTTEAAAPAPAPAPQPAAPQFTETTANFEVRITTASLNIRKFPSSDDAVSPVVGTVKKGEAFTIVATSGAWGKLKSGTGWISCSDKYVTKINANATAPTTASKPSTPSTPSVNVPTFTVGKTYRLQTELKVHTGPSKNDPTKTHRQLSASGQKSDKDKDGALDKGTQITCKEVRKVGNDIWVRCPSGWLAGFVDNKVYLK